MFLAGKRSNQEYVKKGEKKEKKGRKKVDQVVYLQILLVVQGLQTLPCWRSCLASTPLHSIVLQTLNKNSIKW